MIPLDDPTFVLGYTLRDLLWWLGIAIMASSSVAYFRSMKAQRTALDDFMVKVDEDIDRQDKRMERMDQDLIEIQQAIFLPEEPEPTTNPLGLRAQPQQPVYSYALAPQDDPEPPTQPQRVVDPQDRPTKEQQDSPTQPDFRAQPAPRTPAGATASRRRGRHSSPDDEE